MPEEFRVVWQRDGRQRRYKRWARRESAERHVLVLQGRMAEAHPELAPDEPFCCSGYACGCRGLTWHEHWESQARDVPPLVYGPVLQVRPIGEWATLSRAQPAPFPALLIDAELVPAGLLPPHTPGSSTTDDDIPF